MDTITGTDDGGSRALDIQAMAAHARDAVQLLKALAMSIAC